MTGNHRPKRRNSENVYGDESSSNEFEAQLGNLFEESVSNEESGCEQQDNESKKK